MLRDFGYQVMHLWQIWYQQYLKGSSHPWHIHSGHFTGVYYLEHPEGSPSTEILSPYNLETIKVDMVSEGDFIVFPASWIHRGPLNEGLRKTIISFNLKSEIFSFIGTSFFNVTNFLLIIALSLF